MSISTILLILLVLLLIGALPTWPYSGGWGYYPSGGLGLVVIILLVLLAGLGAWQARMHAASVAARRPAARRMPEYIRPA